MNPVKKTPPLKRGNMAGWLHWHKQRILAGPFADPSVADDSGVGQKGLPLEPILKVMARQDTRNAVRDGVLEKQPCAICGSASSEAHHEDYDKPLDVIWLCRAHHAQTHGWKTVDRAIIESEITNTADSYSVIARRHGTSRQRVHQIAKEIGQGARPKVYARQGGRFSFAEAAR